MPTYPRRHRGGRGAYAPAGPDGTPWSPVGDEALRAVFPEDSEPELDQAYALELVTAVHPGPKGPVSEALRRHNPRVNDPAGIREFADSWSRALAALAAAAEEEEKRTAQ